MDMKYLTIPEIVEIYRITQITAKVWVEKSGADYIQTATRGKILVDKAGFEAWIQSNAQKGAAK